MIIFSFIFTLMFSFSEKLWADFSLAERKEYIQKSLSAFDKNSRKNIEEIYKNVGLSEKGRCKSIYQHLTLGCLKEEMKKYCKASTYTDCPLLADVVIVNKVNEKSFVSESDILKLAKNSQNYGEAYGRFLFGKYAFLATDFLFKTKSKCEDKAFVCLSNDIEKFCTQSADNKNLSWQACVSALIWFLQ